MTDVGTAWQWPLQPRPVAVRPFAPGPTPYSPGHYGVDLAAAQGQEVQAAGAGRVSYAGLLAGRGVVVVVHGSLRTTYEPVDAAVAVGAQVVRGQRLGAVATGHACPGPCLHWGLRRGDTYLDPLLLVRGPVRLLPQGAAGRLRAAALGPLLVPVTGAARERAGAASVTSSRPRAGTAAAPGSTSGPGPAPRTADHGRTTSTQGAAGGAARPMPSAAGTPVRAVGRLPAAPALPAASALAGLLVTGAVLLRHSRSAGARRATPTRRA